MPCVSMERVKWCDDSVNVYSRKDYDMDFSQPIYSASCKLPRPRRESRNVYRSPWSDTRPIYCTGSVGGITKAFKTDGNRVGVQCHIFLARRARV